MRLGWNIWYKFTYYSQKAIGAALIDAARDNCRSFYVRQQKVCTVNFLLPVLLFDFSEIKPNNYCYILK